MRTISAKYEKGKEPRFRILHDLRLLVCIAGAAWGYWIRGFRIRRRFRRLQRSGGKYWVDG